MNRHIRAICMGLGLLLLAARAGALTYVSGSLTDTNATNGNGVSTPGGSTDIQYSDGSSGGTYGQIDIADDPADPDWVYDLGSTKAISSLTFWSYGGTTSYSQMPSGVITIYGSSSSSGSWTQIGQVTRSMVRDTNPPNSQATAGEGFRVPCNGSSYRYVRINVVTASSTGGLDNHWVIRRVEENKNLVIHDFHRTSDGSSALNDLPRIPYNAVDGTTSTIWNPGATAMRLTLDLGASARRFQQIIMRPYTNEGSYLPQQGEVLVSSTDDPDNMDTVVGVFDISYNNEDTDNATIILAKPFEKRYVQLHWTRVRNTARTETRFAEIEVDTVSARPTGIDLTQVSSGHAWKVTANDSTSDRAAIQAALNATTVTAVFLPAGTYNLDSTLYMPSNKRLYGNSDDTTILEINNTSSTAIRVEGSDHVILDNFRIHRPTSYANSMDEAIFVYRHPLNDSNGDVPYYVEIDAVKVTDYRSRAPAIKFSHAYLGAVTNCSVYRYQRVITESYAGGSYNLIHGSGVTGENSFYLYFANNIVDEERDMEALRTGPIPSNGAFYQSSAIQVANCQLSVVRENTIDRTGQGIDLSGSDQVWTDDNDIEDCHDLAIKLVNGTTNCWIVNNLISKVGLNAIWLSPGNQSIATRDNLVDNNNIYNVGQGIGAGHWDTASYGLSSWAPAGIVLDKADASNARTQYNTITNNDFYNNGSMQTPTSTYAVWEHTGTYTPVNNTISGNVVH